MLYVFHVDTGTMVTFDMKLAMESVSVLQDEIGKSLKIPTDKQVLLISGGENLNPSARVCSYCSGTDTNPIFLFSKSSIEAATPPSASVNYGSEADLRDQVEGSLNMPPTYETVVARAQLALQFQDVAKEELRVCEKLVHDQHLQHQGWGAVVANLEDITSAFKNRCDIFQQKYADYLKEREDHINTLSEFPCTVHLLERVPILPCLLPSSVKEEDIALATNPQTLLEWISAQDTRGSLEQMTQQCQMGLQQFDESVRETLKTETEELLERINNVSMKEVKGLEDRLYGLEQLMFGARKIVQEQGDMAQGFVQNQNRASNLRDPSVLPDLCNSHRKQLLVMLKNHQNLRDIRRRCTLAKEELSTNLHTRLRWIMYVEKSVCDIDSKLVIHHETLKKLKRKLEIISQINNSPKVYASTVVEVVRRKSYSTKYLEWADNLAEEAKLLYKDEISKRKEFGVFLRHHFLKSLFPGFEDSPPPFATEAPRKFDEKLPPITIDDIENLRTKVPELEEILRVPLDDKDLEKASETTLKDTSSNQGFQTPPSGLSPRRDNNTSDIEILPQNSMTRSMSATLTTQQPMKLSLSADVVCQDLQSKAPVDNLENIQEPSGLGALPGSGSNMLGIAGHGITVDDISQSVEVLEHSEVEIELQKQQQVESESDDDFQSLKPEEYPETLNVPQTSVIKCNKKPGVKPDAIDNKSNKRDSKLTPETSPSLEEVTSEGFTTADFYIDESMPSSMTESPTAKKLAELQHVLNEKSVLIDSQEKELEEQKKLNTSMKSKLEKAQENFKALHSLADRTALQLRCDILNIGKQSQKDKDEFQSYADSITKHLIDVVTNFEKEQLETRDKAIEKIKEEHMSTLSETERKLEVESQKLTDCQQELSSYQAKLMEKTTEYDAMKSELENKLEEMKADHEIALTDCRNKFMLENELELEKIRSDHVTELDTKEEEVKKLQEQVTALESKITNLSAELDKIEENLKVGFKKEKEELQKHLEEENQVKNTEMIQELQGNLEKNHQEEMAKVIEDHKSTISATCEEYTEKNNIALDSLKKELEEKYHNDLAQIKENLGLEHEQKMNALRSDLKQEHEKALQEVKQELQPGTDVEASPPPVEHAATQAGPEGDNSISLEKHGELLQAMKNALEEEHSKVMSKALQNEKELHNQEISSLVEKFEKEKTDSLESMKSSMTAEKQVLFNEALSKVVGEKERVMEELKKNIEDLKADNEKQKETVLKLMEEKMSPEEKESAAIALAKGRENQAVQIQKDLEIELNQARQQILQLQSSVHSGANMGASMAASVMPIPESVPGLKTHEKIVELENTLRNKTEELEKLQQKVNEYSMSGSTRTLVQDKVSITSCNVGDIVLLCLDERHDHYVVFNMGTTLHFLHSECLETLHLKAGPGETKKTWVLAEVTDKEYCQAKKATNRFKVPLGTKFYRIKAMPWDRDSAKSVEGATKNIKVESVEPEKAKET